MKLIADTNVLIRSIVDDDNSETRQARNALTTADCIVIPLVTLCETVWVLRSSYRLSREQVIAVIVRLLGAEKIVIERMAAEAGLAVMNAGGDFADGVIAFEGRRLGGVVFATFDKRAAAILKKTDQAVLLLAAD
ncbi:type II toxin-antitoxin system VapC family toxin [Pararhizobium sp. DWP3-4]|uniref:type II toxin-antitoxin system VapC family toxin n=1 Tax=unclassified Pararhizobium TaxID=2643050 RepID=UPI003CEBC502